MYNILWYRIALDIGLEHCEQVNGCIQVPSSEAHIVYDNIKMLLQETFGSRASIMLFY